MKKFFSFLALLVIITMSNCSDFPENNDPILGIWSQTELMTQSDKNETEVRQEWIFNDAYLGRYHSYINDELDYFTDFEWSLEGEVYTISYPGTDRPIAEVQLQEAAKPQRLALEDGDVFAIRE